MFVPQRSKKSKRRLAQHADSHGYIAEKGNKHGRFVFVLPKHMPLHSSNLATYTASTAHVVRLLLTVHVSDER